MTYHKSQQHLGLNGLAKRRGSAVVLGAAAAVAVLSGCSVANSGAAAGPANAAPDTVRIVLPEEPPTLDPCMNSQSSTGRVTRANITEGLTFRDPSTSEVEPMLATDWEQTGKTTWTFNLREGVQFQDGSPFDAKAVASSIERVLKPALSCDVAAQFFGEISLTPTVVDDHTIEIETSSPDPILPLRISYIGIVPASTDPEERVREVVGTGPYKVGTWDAGTRLTLERFDGYWGDKPDFASVEYSWRTEADIRSAMVETGEADVATTLTPQEKDKKNAVVFETNETAYLRLDPTKAPMDDMRVRQAIDYALDRDGLLASVFGGVGTTASQIVPDSVIGHNSNIAPTSYDMAKAQELVRAAKADGVPVENEITLIGRNNIYPNATQAMEVVQAALTEAGLNVKIEMLDVNAWLEYALRPFPEGAGPTILQGQHGNQAGDASFTMVNNYGSKGGQSTYGTAELDSLIKEAESASGEERQAAFEKALAYQHDQIVRDAVLVRVGGVIAVSDRVAYEPDSATYDEMRVADMKPKG
ncbi:ABC transporter substrate-binding protein [Zafaria cholistanensis]|nr:ABC transporter substrate-binding protein [Zafaria cholistanensis]